MTERLQSCTYCSKGKTLHNGPGVGVEPGLRHPSLAAQLRMMRVTLVHRNFPLCFPLAFLPYSQMRLKRTFRDWVCRAEGFPQPPQPAT